MHKKKIFILIGMVFLISFAMIFSIENFNGFVLGDYVFYKLGFPAWTNGNTGFHNILLVSLVFFIAGIIGLRILQLELNVPTSRLIIIFLIISLLYQPVFRFSYNEIKGFSYGLSSIGYSRKDSKLEIKDVKGNKIIEASFKFHNYSNKERRYFVKVLESDKKKNINPYGDINSPISFSEAKNEVIIPPRTEKMVILNKELPLNSYPFSRGAFSGLDISIFDKENNVEFIRNTY